MGTASKVEEKSVFCMSRVGTVILAAGKGTRMRSRIPKVSHQVGGRALLEHVLRAANDAVSPDPLPAAQGDSPSHSALATGAEAEDLRPEFVVVVGHEREQVRASLRSTPPQADLRFVVQERQLGTGDAVRSARPALRQGTATVLILYGDTPLLRGDRLRALLDRHRQAFATLTFLTGQAPDPTGYGRVVRDADGRVQDIVEKEHATASQAAIHEVNSGVYCFEADWLWSHLERLSAHPNGEYYLTDLVGIAVQDGQRIETLAAPIEETMGINDRIQLAEAEQIMRQQILRNLMLSGVTIEDPATTYVEVDVQVGQDSVLRPGTTLRGTTIIGERCEIGPGSLISDCTIGDECLVLASWLESATMESGSRVGPMSRLRPGAHLLPGAHVGNFGEVKNATLGRDVQMHHFSFIGDATVGNNTNIGAGTITMNYDGKLKHHTHIGEHTFIGCDTLLRAPVTVGDGATTGAGAVVTRDVPPGTLAVGMPARIRQRTPSQSEGSSLPEVDAESGSSADGNEERE
jgi:bifunctional UDP-N-acetylglucosamine pyrophosphorylase / glucosamine-1-phosphate N-acetyltransferase